MSSNHIVGQRATQGQSAPTASSEREEAAMPSVISHYTFQYELDVFRHIDPRVDVPEALYTAEPPLAYLTLNRP